MSNQPPPYWRFRTILNINPLPGNTCVGYAPSKGRGCHNVVNKPDLGKAARMLDEMDCTKSFSHAVGKFEELAYLLLCVRYHRATQVEDICAKWNALADEEYVRMEEERERKRVRRARRDLAVMRENAERLVRELEMEREELTSAPLVSAIVTSQQTISTSSSLARKRDLDVFTVPITTRSQPSNIRAIQSASSSGGSTAVQAGSSTTMKPRDDPFVTTTTTSRTPATRSPSTLNLSATSPTPANRPTVPRHEAANRIPVFTDGKHEEITHLITPNRAARTTAPTNITSATQAFNDKPAWSFTTLQKNDNSSAKQISTSTTSATRLEDSESGKRVPLAPNSVSTHNSMKLVKKELTAITAPIKALPSSSFEFEIPVSAAPGQVPASIQDADRKDYSQIVRDIKGKVKEVVRISEVSEEEPDAVLLHEEPIVISVGPLPPSITAELNARLEQPEECAVAQYTHTDERPVTPTRQASDSAGYALPLAITIAINTCNEEEEEDVEEEPEESEVTTIIHHTPSTNPIILSQPATPPPRSPEIFGYATLTPSPTRYKTYLPARQQHGLMTPPETPDTSLRAHKSSTPQARSGDYFDRPELPMTPTPKGRVARKPLPIVLAPTANVEYPMLQDLAVVVEEAAAARDTAPFEYEREDRVRAGCLSRMGLDMVKARITGRIRNLRGRRFASRDEDPMLT